MTPSDFVELKVRMQQIAQREADDAWRRAAQCQGKHPFESYRHAEHAHHRMQSRHRKSARANIYHCPNCAKWHFGGGG